VSYVEYVTPRVSVSVDENALIRTTTGQPNVVGITGTADWGPFTVQTLSSLNEAKQLYKTDAGTCTLIRGLELLFANGASNVKALRIGASGIPAYAAVSLNNGVTPAITFTAIYKGTYGNNLTVAVTANSGTPANRDVAITDGIVTEYYQNLASNDAIVTACAVSNLVTVTKLTSSLVDAVTATPLTGGLDGDTTATSDYSVTLSDWETENVDVMLFAGQTDATLNAALKTHCVSMANNNKPRICVVGGLNSLTVAQHATAAGTLNSNRAIYTAPGIIKVRADGTEETLHGGFTACAVAGMIASRNVNESTTNQTIAGIADLYEYYNDAEIRELILGGVCVARQFNAFEIAKDVTTATSGAFITVPIRREVDYAISGIRDIGSEYLGRLNIANVRAALNGSLNAFLKQLVVNNIIEDYTVDVHASRDDEIAGRAVVDVRLAPVYSLYYIDCVIFLE